MDTPTFRALLQLRRQIEDRLEWGSAANWSNKDFQTLSKMILDQTDKRISVTTLKRIWGRAQLVANPSVATLDILAEFAGYADWRVFRKQLSEKPETVLIQSRRKRLPPKLLFAGLCLLILAFGLIGYWSFYQKGSRSGLPVLKDLEQIQFDFYKVATGYPNTVIFRYDLGDLDYDSVAIQQSWDESKQIRLSEPKGLAASTYYSPGYYLVKLLIDGRIVKEKQLYIPSEQWQGQIWGTLPGINYLDQKQINTGNGLEVTDEVLKKMEAHSYRQLYLARLEANPTINSSHFTLETKFRLAQAASNSICGNIRLTITGTREVFGFHFSLLGCVGDLFFYLNKEMISGRKQDLSAFGLAPGEWVNCRISVQDKQLKVYRQDQLIFEHILTEDIGRIGGVQWQFEGLPEIKQLELNTGKKKLDLLASQLR